MAKQLGKRVEDIETFNADAVFPDAASHLWSAFSELHEGRTYGIMGPNPISYHDVRGWSELSGISLSYWEVDIIKSLDKVWVRTMNGEEDG